MSNEPLGDRMKERYENRTRYFLPRRTYTIIRLDGKAFHTFTKGFERPYDARITSWMDATAFELCKQIQGCKFAYTQSDEISLLLTDFEAPMTEAWFDGNIQKITSIAASIATNEFNRAMTNWYFDEFQTKFIGKLANFDARVFTIPDYVEVANYFVWRQQDAVRNSIQMLAQSLFFHRELEGKNCSVLQEMTFQKGKNWNDVSVRNKRGGFFIKVVEKTPTGNENIPFQVRTKWTATECPHFTVEELAKYIPKC
jgi:tRNA(His) guanylyltransferase